MQLTRVPVPGPGAEDVVVGTHGPDEGAVFTGTEDGSIFRISHDGRRIDRVAHTGGRPLGIEIDPDGRLLVCDAHRGVLRVDTATGAVEPVTDRVAGSPMVVLQQRRDRRRRHRLVLRLLDDVTASSSGRTTSSRTPAPAGCCGSTPTARSRSSSTGSRSPTASRSARDEAYVAVAETGRAHRRTPLAHRRPRRASATSSSADLPGYPDNIARGSDGLIWVTIASPARPGRRAPPARPRCGCAGRSPGSPSGCSRSRSAPCACRRTTTPGRWSTTATCDTADYHMVTGVREHEGRVWLGSLHEPAVAVLDSGLIGDLPDTVDSRHVHDQNRRPMGYLESISAPRDLRGLTDDQLDDARHRDPRLPGRRPARAPAATSAPTSASSSSPWRSTGSSTPRATAWSSTPATRPTSTSCSPAGWPGSPGSARRAASAATRARPSPTTTSSRTPTPPPRSATPTASPRPTRSAARTATSSPSSATARSPAAWPGRR